MPVVGMSPQGDMLSPHNHQLPDHSIASGFSAPMLGSVAMSATAIGQAVGVISSAASRPPSTLPTSTSVATSSKQLAASRPDVICPLSNLDGSSCRKKCSGTFAYRSICEHIRRAHPEHWIPRLPASVESFNKMIQTPPASRGANTDQGPTTSGAIQPNNNNNNNGGTVRRLNTSSSVKPRAKSTKVKQSTDEQDASGRPPASSIAGSEAQGIASAPAVEARELHIRNSHQPNMASETDTESDHTHSPASPLSMPVLPTATLPVSSSKASPVAKSKTPSLRKKPSGTSGSKTKSSPRKVATRRRTIDKKTSSSALPSLYSTPSASNDDLHSLNDSPDMMDVDTDSTPQQQHYVFGYGNNGLKSISKAEDQGHELDGSEAGLIMNGFSKAHHVSNTPNHGTPQLRRSYSFSAGDCNAHNGSPSSGIRFRGNLAVDTSIGYEYDRNGVQSGSMSAGGIMNGENTGGSRWHDLIEAAIAATKENKVSEKKSPLLYQSVLPVISRGSATPRHNNTSQSDSDIPPSLRMMMDIASAEANLNGSYGQPQNTPLDHAHSQNCIPNYSHFQHHYMQNGDAYNRHQNGYSASSYQFHPNYSGNAVSHTNISPILNGASLASLESSTVASHASTPAYSKPSSPNVETMSTFPKVECSICRAQVDISMSLACTECIHGFCHRCVMPSETSNIVETKDGAGYNKRRIASPPDLKLRNGDAIIKRLPFTEGSSPVSKCGVCGVTGARFKPIRLIVRV